MKQLAHVVLTPNGKSLSEAFRELGVAYPKFHKMDGLCKLGFVASEQLLASTGEERFVAREDRAIVLFSRHGCLKCDEDYQATLDSAEGYFPSPSLFVYSLPNIVAGELAIRNQYQGETAMYLLPARDENTMRQLIEDTLQDPATTSVLAGWLDFEDADHYEADLAIYNI